MIKPTTVNVITAYTKLYVNKFCYLGINLMKIVIADIILDFGICIIKFVIVKATTVQLQTSMYIIFIMQFVFFTVIGIYVRYQ